MTKNFNLSHSRVLDVLDYRPETGVFTWKVRMSSKAMIGDIAGSLTKAGYRVLTLDGFFVHAPRLAWFYVNKEWPKHIIRFVDGDRTNCRINNLRDTVDVTGGIDYKQNGDAYSKKGMRSDYSRHFDLKKKYGITLEEYKQRIIVQKGVCAICGNPETATKSNGTLRTLAVDHNHSDGSIRDLLCQACNVSIGQMGESPERLRSAAEYLERHKRIVHIDDNKVVNLHPRYSDKQEFSTK